MDTKWQQLEAMGNRMVPGHLTSAMVSFLNSGEMEGSMPQRLNFVDVANALIWLLPGQSTYHSAPATQFSWCNTEAALNSFFGWVT